MLTNDTEDAGTREFQHTKRRYDQNERLGQRDRYSDISEASTAIDVAPYVLLYLYGVKSSPRA